MDEMTGLDTVGPLFGNREIIRYRLRRLGGEVPRYRVSVVFRQGAGVSQVAAEGASVEAALSALAAQLGG